MAANPGAPNMDYEATSRTPIANKVMNDHYRRAVVHKGGNVLNGVTMNMLDTGNQAAKLLALGGGGLTLGGLLYANAQRKAKEQKAKYPTKVIYG